MPQNSREKRGERTDNMLMGFLSSKPGLPLYQISEELGWSTGKVQKSLERLARKGQIHFKRLVTASRVLKLAIPSVLSGDLTPAKYILASPGASTISIPVEILDRGEWKDTASLYTLDRNSIGIAPKEVLEWNQISLFTASARIDVSDDSIRVDVPPNINRFYMFEEMQYSVASSPDGKSVLVTIQQPEPPMGAPLMTLGKIKKKESR